MSINQMSSKLRAAIILCGSVLSLVSSANADTPKQLYLRQAQIPFAFRVGAYSLPAGNYRLEPWIAGSQSYHLTNVETGKSLMVQYFKHNTEPPTQLKFERDKTGYVLRSVQ